MKTSCIGKSLLFLGILLIPLQTMAGPVEGSLNELDALVGRWMTLRTTIAEEKRQWSERRDQWRDEIRLLQQESAMLKKEISRGDTFASSVENERAAVLARKAHMESELEKLRGVLDRAEADLKKYRNVIPEGMAAPLVALFKALPETQRQADKLPLTKRAQTVAALYSQIETIQNRFHAFHETLDINGVRRQVDVLYVGLARSFAVSPADDWAAVGMPRDDGWAWSEQDEEAAVIRAAIDIFNQKKTAGLVTLPMQVSGGAYQ